MTQKTNPNDPKGLMRESYRIEGISDAECRSILMDWALSLSDEVEQRAALQALLAHYGDAHADHPMTALLREGLAEAPLRRRGRAHRT